MGFSCPQMLPTGSTLSYSLIVQICVLSSSMYFELCQFSDFHCGNFFKFKMAARYLAGSLISNYISQSIWMPNVVRLSSI